MGFRTTLSHAGTSRTSEFLVAAAIVFAMPARAEVGVAFVLSPTVYGTNPVISIFPPLPPGLEIDADDGVISGVPTCASFSDVLAMRQRYYDVTIVADEGTFTFPLDLSVTFGNSLPLKLVDAYALSLSDDYDVAVSEGNSIELVCSES